jgi:hypothetical protein
MLILVAFSFPINACHNTVGMVAQEYNNGGKARVNNSEVQPPDETALDIIDNPSATTATVRRMDGMASQSYSKSLKMGLQNAETVNKCMVGAACVESDVSKCKQLSFLWASGYNSRRCILIPLHILPR